MKDKKALLIAFGVALFALMMVFSYISGREKELLDLATPIKVVVALKDIPLGTRLDDTYIEEKIIPKKYVQPGAAGNLTDIADRFVSIPILKNTQILESMLMSAETASIATRVPKDMRAFTSPATEVTAVAGLVQPGDYVDVMATFEVGSYEQGRSKSEDTFTKTILENILVLAVNSISSKAEGAGAEASKEQSAPGSLFRKSQPVESGNILRTLTLALKPDDVQRMNLAQEIGSISVSLRSRWDTGKVMSLPQLKARDFLGIEKTVIPKSAPAWIDIQGASQKSRY